MAAIRAMATIAEKWKNRAGSAGPQYQEGVQQPKKDWATAAGSAQGNWDAGVTQASAMKTFQKGVAQAGTPKWQSKAISKVVSRFPQGVADAQPDYSHGFEKYRNVIEGTQLPNRFAKGDPRNLDRVKSISTALRKAKTG